MRMLDLFCGRFGWGKAFAARGWQVVGIDLVEPPDIPEGCTFIKADILQIVANKGRFSIYENDAGEGTGEELWTFEPDFICASSPCEQFSVHGMKHFHPNPPYPELGMKLFSHTKRICEQSGVPVIMENVRAAEAFVGQAVSRCGSFALWGSVPPILPQGINKTKWKKHTNGKPGNWCPEFYMDKKKRAAILATIPPELANCVADYAERICAG